MRILFFSTDFRPNPGGVATFLHHLAAQLVDLGHEVDVLAPARAGDAESDANQSYRVYRYAVSERRNTVTCMRAGAYVDHDRCISARDGDLVQRHWRTESRCAHTAVHRRRVPHRVIRETALHVPRTGFRK